MLSPACAPLPSGVEPLNPPPDANPLDDLHACLDGDAEAWARFAARWSAVIAAAVRRAAGSGAGPPDTDIDDLIQDVFVRLVKEDFRLLRTYDPERAALSTWLTIVARSTTIDRLRRKRLATAPLDEAPPAIAPPPPENNRPEPVDIPRHLLTERQRLVLRLAFDDGRDVPTIAHMLDISEQTVRSTRHKALARLRKHFEDHRDPDTPTRTDQAAAEEGQIP